MTREEELRLLEQRINENTMVIWNGLENRLADLWRDLKHVRMTAVAVLVVTGNEPGRPDQRIYAVATAADATIPAAQIDMILDEASAVRADTVTKEVRPQ